MTQLDICNPSETPRTDEYEGTWATEYHNGLTIFEHARQLERELNALKASIAKEDSDEMPEEFRRICLLFTKRCTRTKFGRGEKKAWESVVIREHDMELLEWFYGLPKSMSYDQTWHRKGQPAALLNNLNAQLDLAFEMKEALRKSQPKLGTPTKW